MCDYEQYQTMSILRKTRHESAQFKDHFSHDSAAYSKHRPGYPRALFTYLSSIAGGHNLAWDCATGSGQSAIQLADSFKSVIATDASESQIRNSHKHNNVHYYVAAAEYSAIKNNSLDLITVAQALHWFDLNAFSAEVDRALKKDGIIAAWSYNLLTVRPDIDNHIRHFYATVLKQYWPAERSMVENGYNTVNFPLKELKVPAFHMSTDWTPAQLTSYISTWSAVNAYVSKNHHNPIDLFYQKLVRLWGDSNTELQVKWPLTVRAWQK